MATPNIRQAPLGILPQSAFKELTRTGSFDRYRLDPRTRVADERRFDEMRGYLDDLYKGIEAVHSFEDPAGHVFDCIPIEQQPSLRGVKGPIPRPPDLNPVLRGHPAEPSAPILEPLQLDTRRDRHGNRMQAPAGTIPMRRVSLDELARFPDLREFLRKDRGPRQPQLAELPVKTSGKTVVQDDPPSLPAADSGLNHRYAYTRQTVDNIGAHNSLSLHAPTIDANQIFSLAQHWYGGGSGANHQTLEIGWQVYPVKYGHAQPVLFIYWTADNYVSTGAYNLDSPGFVQTNGSWTIGGSLSPVSVLGGTQMEIEVAVFLSGGNWWIYLGGLSASDAIGYYPTSLYSGGQMASNATEILFGGETVTSAVSWPPMGSGEFAATGWQQAAYQRNIFYFPTGGGSQWAALTPEEPSPACYTLTLAAAAAPWGVYFFYGGPGGGDC